MSLVKDLQVGSPPRWFRAAYQGDGQLHGRLVSIATFMWAVQKHKHLVRLIAFPCTNLEPRRSS